MGEISEIEIKSMTKEQNYMRGYFDGKQDVLDKIKSEIKEYADKRKDSLYGDGLRHALEIIDKYREREE